MWKIGNLMTLVFPTIGYVKASLQPAPLFCFVSMAPLMQTHICIIFTGLTSMCTWRVKLTFHWVQSRISSKNSPSYSSSFISNWVVYFNIELNCYINCTASRMKNKNLRLKTGLVDAGKIFLGFAGLHQLILLLGLDDETGEIQTFGLKHKKLCTQKKGLYKGGLH